MGNIPFMFGNCLNKNYTKVKANGAIHYAEDKAVYHDTYNMVCSGEDKASAKNREFVALQNAHNIGYNNRKFYHYFFSTNLKDVNHEQLCFMLKKAFDMFLPEAQAVISGHDDTDNTHVNVIVNSVMLNGKMVQINDGLYNDIKTYLQYTLPRELGYDAEKTPFQKAKEQGIKYKRHREQPHNQAPINRIDEKYIKRNEKSEKMKIQEKINEIIEKDKPINIEKLKELCLENGINVSEYKTKSGDTQLSFKTDKLKYGLNFYQLGNDFKLENLEKAIIKAQEKPKTREEELEEQIKNFKIRHDPDGMANMEDIMAKAKLESELSEIKTQRNILNNAKAKYDKEVQECKDTIKSINEKIDSIPDKQLQWYNNRYGTNYSKQWFKNEAQRIYDKDLPPKSILSELNGLLSIVFKIINTIMNYIKAQERASQNNYDRGGR